MKSEADLVFPARRSQILTEITALKNLQDEQLALANTAHALTLYYISGGNEDPGFKVQDKVRPEDHDLRGWFSKTYGEKYLEILYNQLSGNPDQGIITIKADFVSNDHGYGMRQMALNDYHLANILANAKRTRTHRSEASSYAKQLCILAGRALFSGDPPTGDLFEILNSSISIWYELNFPSITIPSAAKMLNGKLTLRPYNGGFASYPFFLLAALYDMHKQGTAATTWKETILANGMSTTDIDNLFTNLDPVIDPAILDPVVSELNNARGLYNEVQQFIATNYNPPPSNHIWNGSDERYAYVKRRLQMEHDILLEVGDEIPRGLELSSYTAPDGSNVGSTNTDFFWASHDNYQSALQNLAMADSRLQNAQAAYTALGPIQPTYDTYHAQSVWVLLEATKLATIRDGKEYIYYNPDLVQDIVEAVLVKVMRITNSRANGNPMRLSLRTAEAGHAYISPMRGAVGASLNGAIDIFALISFYARGPLRGVTPKAYWVSSLSHKIVVREVLGVTGFTGYDAFLYQADLKTGGITLDDWGGRMFVGRISGDRESALSIVASFYPDIGVYTPGLNEPIPRSVQSSYEAKLLEDASVKQWLNNTQKALYNYVYIAESKWKHGLDLLPASWTSGLDLDDAKVAAEGLTMANYVSNPVTNSRSVATDFLILDSIAGKKHFGVNTFSPNISHLHYRAEYGGQLNLLNDLIKDGNRQIFNAKNTLHRSQLKLIAFPQSVTNKIIEWTKTVPSQIIGLLNAVNAKPDSGWYEFKHTVNRNTIYNPTGKHSIPLEQTWPEYRTEKGFRTTDLLNKLEPFYKFLANRTESLFISSPKDVLENAYLRLAMRKPSETDPEVKYILAYSNIRNGLGNLYHYLAILGALYYFNSYHLYTDTSPSNRTYPYWCGDSTIRNGVDKIVDGVLGGSVTPLTIYTTPMNDLEDVSNIHQILSNLKVLDGMTEMPVFDVPEFNVKWSGQTGSVINPFTNNPDGFPDIPKQGLTASMTPRLSNNYGDSFYKALFDTCVMQPNFTFDGRFSSSFLRIPVRTNGVSGKVYGNRPSSGTMESAAVDTRVSKFVQGGGIASDVNIALGVGTLAALASIYGLFRAASGYRVE